MKKLLDNLKEFTPLITLLALLVAVLANRKTLHEFLVEMRGWQISPILVNVLIFIAIIFVLTKTILLLLPEIKKFISKRNDIRVRFGIIWIRTKGVGGSGDTYNIITPYCLNHRIPLDIQSGFCIECQNICEPIDGKKNLSMEHAFERMRHEFRKI